MSADPLGRPITRRTFTALAAAGLVGAGRAATAAAPAPDRQVRVLVWDERQPAQQKAYGGGWLGDAIADHLRRQPGYGVRSVALADADQGLSDQNLEAADVLVWWGHLKHRDVLPNAGKRIVERVRAGKLSLIALHSAHWATPFVAAMNARATDDAMKLLSEDERNTTKVTVVTPLPGKAPKRGDRLTPDAERRTDPATGQAELVIRLPMCVFPAWRNDGKPSRVTVLRPDHPVAAGLPKAFDIPQTEMYDDPFHVPKPDATLFLETWQAGERFNSGLVWNLGKGKVFYFRPGHEDYPIYKEEMPLKVIENACRWLSAEQARMAGG